MRRPEIEQSKWDGRNRLMAEEREVKPSLGHSAAGERRSIVYCLIPRDLAPTLHDPLRRHFADDPSVEVVVESRKADRRKTADRRKSEDEPPGGVDRRRVRAVSGRRIAERRATVVEVAEPPALPRRARRYAERLRFFERLEPSTQQLEDRDTARIVARFQAGERTVFSELYLRYFDRVYSFLRSMLRDPHEAEDLSQQAFLQLLEALPDYERRSQPFRAWLFVLVRNIAISHLRRQGKVELDDPQEERQRAEPSVAEMPLTLGWLSDRDLHVLVERLPPTQRQVLLLRFMLDLPATEVAAILGRSPVWVRKTQGRAIAFLRERLTALGRVPHRRIPPSGWRRPTTQVRVLRDRRWALVR